MLWILPTAFLWMKSFMDGRRQMVYYNGYFSVSCHMYCGLPQGSCLGPLVYLDFANDLPYALNKSSVVMYADDSVMFYSANHFTKLTSVLAQELLAVPDWVGDNNIIFAFKCKSKSVLTGGRLWLANSPQ